MPRPSKHVSPDTLGGRIRAARENLQLSLADVADGHYSTSLLSQIERNRVDPSQESLRFLANRLQLPFEDLVSLAHQLRETEVEARDFRSFEDLRIEISQLYTSKDFAAALRIYQDFFISQVPTPLRWRLAALRGHIFFEQRKFLKAQQDFIYAFHEMPRLDPALSEQKHELMLLRLHLAGTYRELRQFDDAFAEYQMTLQLINHETPFGYVAEAHWGMALIAFAQANQLPPATSSSISRQKRLRLAQEHAENARFLYRAIGEQLRAATVTCQIAQIEHALGATEKVRSYLEEVLSSWSFTLDPDLSTQPLEKRRQQEEANVVSLAACSLAGLELDTHNFEQACYYVNLALAAAQRCYKLRRADAFLMQGRILEAIDPGDPAIETALRNATAELADTDRISARISAHVRLGHHLLKQNKLAESALELEQARLLSDLVSASSPAFSLDDAPAS